jgi:hypothetical protein
MSWPGGGVHSSVRERLVQRTGSGGRLPGPRALFSVLGRGVPEASFYFFSFSLPFPFMFSLFLHILFKFDSNRFKPTL